MGFIFKGLSIIGGWVALIVLAVSISAGLYLACELAEEFSSTVKRYLHRSTIGIGVTFLILAIDGLPFKRCAFGFFTYVAYLPLLANFPFVTPISVQTILAIAVTIANHFSWFSYFLSYEYKDEIRSSYADDSLLYGGSPAMKVMGFLFIFVWFVPLGFFISLTSIDDSLPFANNGPGQQRKAKGIFKSFVDSLKLKLGWEKDSYQQY